ncbi:MAG: hypothetical protein JSW52_10430 [Candidatus Coatesbacteria bacterium]|nr:MAG: hypothetical protein JSW52_10430 [Candidatus Coatesbacteria bacterium]
MERYSVYFKWSAVLLFLYAVVTLAAWVALAAGMGWPPLSAGPASSVQTLDAYASGGMTAYNVLTYISFFLVVPALPAMFLLLFQKFPGLAVSGLTLGSISYVLAMLDVFVATGAGATAGGSLAETAFVGTLTRGDLTLTLDTIAAQFFVPSLWFGILFTLVWGAGYSRLAGVARWAGAGMLASVFFAFVTFAGFFIGSGVIANLGVLAQTVAAAAAFGLAGIALRTNSRILKARDKDPS